MPICNSPCLLVSQLYCQNISNHLSRQDNLSFTQDAWTDPNIFVFMGVAVHFIDKYFKMHDLTVSIPHVQGNFHLIIFEKC
ncbi:uncharacterized protein VP01_338g5 [Puccinia sorghi]|uniref:Uncharacterized protein n=1 Tax=Puccinia sorghi TaxID=27349 RepID=A0A0L6UWS5_9BASI|nr:uncharacterized protein VP01_338g5 [Puccinia sorghi]